MEKEERVQDITAKTWRSIENSLTKEGYREGAAAGKESVLQGSFDSGYNEGFKMSYAKGFLHGFLSVLEYNDIAGVPKCLNEKDELSRVKCVQCSADDGKTGTESVKELHQCVRENVSGNIMTLKTKYGDILRTMDVDPDAICCKKTV